MSTTKRSLFTLVFALLAFVQGALAQKAPAGLSIDTDYKSNQAGYYYVNMPLEGTTEVDLQNSDLVFKIYDNGGKNGPYDVENWGYVEVLLRAPAGYIFEVTGTIVYLDADNQLSIYDGGNDRVAKKLYCYGCDYYEPVRGIDNIGTYETMDNIMLVRHEPGSDPQKGFELTVRMKPNTHIHNISINQQLGGTWKSNAGRTAIASRYVDLTFTPEVNRVLASVKVIKTGDASTEIPLTKLDDNRYRFTMPDYDVTVVPSAYDWEWTSGNTICHLDNQGVFKVRAIAGTNGAMADYDNTIDVPWLSKYNDVKTLVVERGVTTLGRYVFFNLEKLTSVSLPDGLREIHHGAFWYCDGLPKITIPHTVTSVSAKAFYYNRSLAHIYNYAHADAIRWDGDKTDFQSSKKTQMHVLPSQFAAYQAKFGDELNVTFVSDLTASGNWTDAGNYADEFSQENGKTITITNEAEMARLAYMVNVAQNTYTNYTFKLARDLNMDSHIWSPIGTGPFSYRLNQRPFMGTFDGQGHTINGIIVNRSGSAYNGLFGFVGELEGYRAYGEVKNLSLKQSTITGGQYTGGLVGYLQYGKVTNCFTDATVNGGQYVGGLVGAMEGHSTNGIKASVTKSLYMGSDVRGVKDVRAVVGYRKKISYCEIEAFYTNRNLFALTKYDVHAVKVSDDSFEDITVTISDKGKVVYEGNTYAATDGSATFTVRATDPYRALSSVAVNGHQIATKAGTFTFEAFSNLDVCHISATLDHGELAGSGTKEDPFLISNKKDWDLFAELVAGGATFSGKFVKQVDQIGDQTGNGFVGITTMVGESPELSFQGTYDGSMNYIIGSINSTADYAAPFRFVKNATIKNVKVAGTFNVGKHGSALVGRTFGNTLIDSVWVHKAASISSSRKDNRYMGGVVGHGGNSALTMKNILFDGNLTNDGEYTGGLLGWTDGMTLNLDSCTFRGNFSGNGAFHPIAVRVPYASMRTTAKDVYFYAGPKNIDNGHIGVSAIRVQSEPPADGSYGTAVDALTGNKTSYYYNDAPKGFHIDYDKERGSAGYYFVNMQCENMNQRVVVGSGMTSFMIYDDGGKLSNACGANGDSKLTVVAPNSLLEVQGRVVGLDVERDYLSIGDDAGHTLFYFGYGDYDDPEWADIPSATTAGHVLFVSTGNEADGQYDGYEIQVTLQSDGNDHFGAVTIVHNGLDTAYIDGAYTGDDETMIPETYLVDKVVLDREFKVGAFSTIMLPFDMSEFGIDLKRVHGAEFYGISEMTYVDGKWIAGATKLEGFIAANTPYLVKPTDTKITFDGEAYLNTTTAGDRKTVQGDWEFRGTYKRFVFGDSSEILGSAYGFVAHDTTISGKDFAAGQFVKAGRRAYILPMRAYLVRVGANSSAKNADGFGGFGELPESIDLKIMDEKGNVTETATLNTRTGEVKRDRWFDLQGRKLNGKPTDKGKYLHNGKVEVVR